MSKQQNPLENNIKNTALIFEGGGMRASYSAGLLSHLLENQLYFDYVAGISAGASCGVNYLSRDIDRAKRSFVDVVQDPQFGGWRSFLSGEGYFRAEYIYEKTPQPDGTLPLDYETFARNPARLRIGAFQMATGNMTYFSREDIQTPQDLMKIVRASSSLPLIMPPARFRDTLYVDGGLSGGIALEIAQRDGFERFFVILTRPRGYRKPPMKYAGLVKALYRKYPRVAEAMMQRHIHYNRTLDELESLESDGKALLVYPDAMPISQKEKTYAKLLAAYHLGDEQGKRDLPAWKAFLEKG
ncbi:patatin family protein [Anoxynatronum sibiricum]|uniref:Patatin family protein n=1 Tax=Anoxynatronum sibiricum TaxID=210623 RepID=A0ABU9VW20_9CLOT